MEVPAMPAIALIAALIAVPLVEIAVFIRVGDTIGLWPTLVAVVATAVAGAALIRAQGIATLARARDTMSRGQVPLGELFDAFCLLIAGALLLTPGFVTDAVGLALLLPAVRRTLQRRIGRQFLDSGGVWINGEPQRRPGTGSEPGGDVIEGEYTAAEPSDRAERR
jgi:UPF0716 protein FxsA